jgi:hypothetical protein
VGVALCSPRRPATIRTVVAEAMSPDLFMVHLVKNVALGRTGGNGSVGLKRRGPSEQRPYEGRTKDPPFTTRVQGRPFASEGWTPGRRG